MSSYSGADSTDFTHCANSYAVRVVFASEVRAWIEQGKRHVVPEHTWLSVRSGSVTVVTPVFVPPDRAATRRRVFFGARTLATSDTLVGELVDSYILTLAMLSLSN
jgi:hypothetical protein